MPNAKAETLYHALFLAQHLSRGDLKDGLAYILFELEMPSHIIGYHYARNAILMFYRNPAHMVLQGIYQAVIDELYPTASYDQLDQSIRSAIDYAHKNCEPDTWNIYFHPKPNRKRKRPTNYEFISRITTFMELWQACVKEASYEN